jgi:hypothetical protein
MSNYSGNDAKASLRDPGSEHALADAFVREARAWSRGPQNGRQATFILP